MITTQVRPDVIGMWHWSVFVDNVAVAYGTTWFRWTAALKARRQKRQMRGWVL